MKKHLPGNSKETLKTSAEQCPGKDSNWACPKYKLELPLTLTCSVIVQNGSEIETK
jgi:hypothetical protein